MSQRYEESMSRPNVLGFFAYKKGALLAYATTEGHLLYCYCGNILFLRSLTVAAHELVYATGSIHEFALTGIERVRGARDFDFNHWVSFAFEFYGVICLCGRTRKERTPPNFAMFFYSSSTMMSLGETSSIVSSLTSSIKFSWFSLISSASSPLAISSCWRFIRLRSPYTIRELMTSVTP